MKFYEADLYDLAVSEWRLLDNVLFITQHEACNEPHEHAIYRYMLPLLLRPLDRLVSAATKPHLDPNRSLSAPKT